MSFEALPAGAYPLHRHPFYADKTEETLATWFAVARRYGDAVKVPVMSMATRLEELDSPKDMYATALRVEVLTLVRCATKAVPYVGIPAVCEWWALKDAQGRCIGPPASRLKQDVLIEQLAEQYWFGDRSIRPLRTTVHRVFHDDGSHHHEFFHPYLAEWVPLRWP